MKISHFSFIVTDACNFQCSYCFQKKEPRYMERATIRKAAPFIYPFLNKDQSCIAFFGGEPLLAFDNITSAVHLFQKLNREEKKNITFTLTTNGSLLTDHMLRFFDRHRFSLMLSFDGTAQEIGRRPRSLQSTRALIPRIQTYPHIKFSTNSVFTPATIPYFSESLQYIIQSGAPALRFSLSTIQPWDQTAQDTLARELERLIPFLVSYYKRHERIPVEYFRPPAPPPPSQSPPGDVFHCDAGRHRIALSPEENLWGCSLFHDYLKDKEESDDFRTYSFGKLDRFIEDHETLYPEIIDHYTTLRQDCFLTGEKFCFLCPDVGKCRVCPVSAAYSSSFIGKIAPWVCNLNRLQKNAKKKFLEIIDLK
ncbi:MAG: radical SAM protein [bacterium]|nr:radical SAM protein [bacterium]